MKRAALLIAIFGIVTVAPLPGQTAVEPYRPAQITYTPRAAIPIALEIYPFHGPAFRIPLPLAVGHATFSADGEAIYGQRSVTPRVPPTGLAKIEFNPMHLVNPLPGSEPLAFINNFGIAPLKDKIFVSGWQLAGRKRECGIFEYGLADHELRLLVQNPENCNPPGDLAGQWIELSVSPDGSRATALRNKRLELIDLTSGKIQTLSENFGPASWSPDGKWLAIPGSQGVVLLDAKTLSPDRVLPGAGLEWSPDSRYLLTGRADVLCLPGELGTLWAVDVGTGKAIRIDSSRCKIDTVTGWVSSDIRR